MRSLRLLTIAAALALTATAHASTVYTQTLNLNRDGGPYSYFGQAMFDEFNLASAASISGAEWYGDNFANSFAPTQSFEIAIHDSNGSGVGAALFSSSVMATAVNSGLTDGGSDQLFRFQASFAPVSLAAGHNYWLSITDTSSNAAPSGVNYNQLFRWANGHTGFAGDAGNYFLAGGVSQQISNTDLRGQAAYSLIASAVPEPETYALLMLGLGMVGAIVRRKKSA